jgi:HEAT repeat protein
LVGLIWVCGVGMPAAAQDGASPGVSVPDDATVESLFVDFLHYARLGRFTMADAFARALLEHPDLNPVELLEVANRDKKSIDTLLIIIKNSSIGENAARVLELLEVGEFEKRKEPERIRANIEKLGGDPQQEYIARRNLIDSGEYAIPPLIAALLDPGLAHLRPRIVSALGSLDKPAVNPLVVALAIRDDDIRLNLIQALGEIGYPQAIPYLRKLIADPNGPAEAKTAAARAIMRIEAITGRVFPGSPDVLFFRLAEKYYDEDPSVRADPRLQTANVWYWDDTSDALSATVVPQRIFGAVMAMRCCEEALLLRNDSAEAIALWLAANIRRESRSGMDIESGDPDEVGESDDTRPAIFPRALYFSLAAGPRYAHLVLDRAVRDNDSAVALGALEALRTTAGESSLIGTEDYKQPLVEALKFPDLVVRIRAALALGAALPKSPFADSEFVVPVLAKALTLTGREQVLVIDNHQSNLNRVMDALRAGDRDVIGDTRSYRAMERARTEFHGLSGVFISTDAREPALPTVLSQLRSEFMYAKTPVVLLTKPGQSVLAEQVESGDPYAEAVDAAADGVALEAALERVRSRTGRARLDPDLALSLALKAAETLHAIGVDGRTVYGFGVAEPALIVALSSDSEELQTTAASVLALARTSTAQRAVAMIALDAGNVDSLRISAFNSLAESAKHNGNLLEERQIAQLVEIARDDTDLTIRTAASEALGALNLATNKASEIIRSYYGG